MGVFKAISKSDAVRRILCALGAVYIRLVHAMTRWDERGRDTPEALWDAERPFILAFWHGRLLMMAPFWRKSVPMNMLISQHRDGRLIADTIHHFGIGTVAGSSSKGGGAALRQMLRAIKAGECVGITPDGPRGPRMRAAPGIIALARLANAPIVPAVSACTNAITLSSWDRFQLVLPFGRGVYLWGAPIEVGDMDEETARAHIEKTMNDLTAEADRIMGRPGVEPAPTEKGQDI